MKIIWSQACLAIELLKAKAPFDLIHTPYKGVSQA